MTKGNWLLGGVRGKLGDLVFSKSKGEQITRSRNRSPKNPKTAAQALQRMRFAGLASFYNAFASEILDHSWQGVKYGGDSHNYFYKLALAETVTPVAVAKNSRSFVPTNYPMSRGSLQGVEVNILGNDMQIPGIYQNAGFLTTLKLPNDFNASNGTLGYLIEQIVLANPTFAKKQLTFVLVGRTDEGIFVPIVQRIILNKDAYTTEQLTLSISDKVTIARHNNVEFLIFGSNTYISVAGCVIVSEWNGSTWARSNTDLFIGRWMSMDYYFGSQPYEDAIKSYMTAEVAGDKTSDKYLNGAGDSESSVIPVARYSFIQTATNVKIGENTYGEVQLRVMGLSMSDGSWRLASTSAHAESGKPISPNGFHDDTLWTDSGYIKNELTWKQLIDLGFHSVSNMENKLIAYKEEYKSLPKK